MVTVMAGSRTEVALLQLKAQTSEQFSGHLTLQKRESTDSMLRRNAPSSRGQSSHGT